jgi:hypothetical protein
VGRRHEQGRPGECHVLFQREDKATYVKRLLTSAHDAVNMLLTRGHIPQPDHLVITCRGQGLLVRGKSNGTNHPGVQKADRSQAGQGTCRQWVTITVGAGLILRSRLRWAGRSTISCGPSLGIGSDGFAAGPPSALGGRSAKARWVSRPAPPNPSARSITVAILSFVGNMVWSTPFARAATSADIRSADTAFAPP